MRILFLSNFYPPTVFGGYELRCRDVVEGMRARGHDVHVATSRHGSPSRRSHGQVHRILTSFWDLPHSPANREAYIRTVARDNQELLELTRRVRPDVLSLWNMLGLAYAVPAFALGLGLPALLHIEDDWLLADDHTVKKYGPIDESSLSAILAPGERRFFPLARPASLEFHTVFSSRFRHERHAPLGPSTRNGAVVHGGIDTRLYDATRYRNYAVEPPGKFLFIGAHTEAKAPHLAVEALARVAPPASLTLAGFHLPSAYLDSLLAMPARLGIEDRVTFLGPLSPEGLLAAYGAHDALLFTSTAPEGFPLTIQEAMGMGMAVITSLTGGHAEYVEDGVNAFVFDSGDAACLARQMAHVMGDPADAARVAAQGRQCVRDRFSLERMLDELEALLERIALR